jgi:hypothetical protein
MTKILTFKIEGTVPMIMHNGQLANPLNPIVKKMKSLTSQRKKTDEILADLSKLEFRGGLYLSPESVVVIPSEVLESCLIEGAKKSKLGKQFKSAISIAHDSPLDYGKKFTVEELWERNEQFADVRGVKVGTSRIMRTRPIFRDWRLTFVVTYNCELVNPEQISMAVTDAGTQVGLCDYRPKFGRFTVVSVE